MSDSFEGTRETLLVVDDDASVLRLVVKILGSAGFRVLSARSGAEAIELARNTKGRIDLLLSDIDMPSMTGPQLGRVLKETRPDLHIMLMSGGGPDGNLLVLNYGWAFIAKPFVPQKLAQMVTDVLHSPDRSQSGDEFDSRKEVDIKPKQLREDP